jgi:hypothetical protein
MADDVSSVIRLSVDQSELKASSASVADLTKSINDLKKSVDSATASVQKGDVALGKDTPKAAKEAQSSLKSLAEEGRKLREVGATFAGLGAAITAPFIVVANEYEARFKGLESTANKYAAAQQKQADATAALGRVAATALIPAMNEVATITEKIANLAEAHPELVRGAVSVGAALVAGGGALAAVGTVQDTLSKVAEIAGSGGLVGNITKGVASIALFAAALEGTVKVINAIGDATGDTRLKMYSLGDALKSAREVFSGIFLVFMAGLVNARNVIVEIFDITRAVLQKFNDALGKGEDDIGTFIVNFIEGLARVLDQLDTGFTVVINSLRQSLENVMNSILELIAGVLEKIPGLGGAAKDVRASEGKVDFTDDSKKKLDAYNANEDKRQKAITDNAAYNTQQQAKRDADDKALGVALADDAKGIDEANKKLADLAGNVANFAETGSLGKDVDNFLKGIGGTIQGVIGNITGGLLGGSSASTGVNGTKFSPEAVKDFIAYKKQLTESDKSYHLELLSAQTEYQNASKKAQRDYQDSVTKAEADSARTRQQDHAKALEDFNHNEAAIEKKAAFDRAQQLRNTQHELYNLEKEGDVAGYITKQQDTKFQQSQEDRQAAFDKADRQKQFAYDEQQKDKEAKVALADTLQNLRVAHDKEEADRKIAYDQQLQQLATKHAQEKQQYEQAFAEQLAALQDNIANLHNIQTAGDMQQAADLQAFVNSQGATLRQLYSQATGYSANPPPPPPDSTGYTTPTPGTNPSTPNTPAPQLSDLLSSLVGGVGNIAGGLLGGLIPSHATGLNSVPFDNYLARLHKGETIIPANQAKQGSQGHTFNINIGAGNNVTKSDVEQIVSSAFGELAGHLAL